MVVHLICMTTTIISASKWVSLLKRAATGETSVLLWVISKWRLLILQWMDCPLSSTYCWPLSGRLLATLDVSLLCTNIPHDEGIVACKEALNLTESLGPPTADICHLIRLILPVKSFKFNQIHYLQIQGTAMGTSMAPYHANLFMGKLEQEFLQTQNKKSRVRWRYIDNIFAIWTHDEPYLYIPFRKSQPWPPYY